MEFQRVKPFGRRRLPLRPSASVSGQETVAAGRVTFPELLRRPAPLAPLAADEVALWRLAWSATQPVPEACAAVLDEAERERAARFVREEDRRRFVLSHGVLRHILAAHTGREPAAITYALSPWGKPSLYGGGPQFNLSHAGDCVLVAVSADQPVGVDVEAMRALPDADALVTRFFAVEEQQAYRACSATARIQAFYAIWTRKEAYSKALGGGLSIPLDAFAVSLEAPVRVLRPFPEAPSPGPSLYAIPVPSGYAGALAGRADRILCREILL